MKKRRRIRKLICVLVCALLCLAALPAGTSLAQEETVRVGFFAYDGYHMKNGNGDMSGYGYDFLQYLSGYTQLQFEFVNYDASWGEAQEMLANGEIDLLTSAQKTPEREARFDFSARPIGTSASLLTVKAGNTAFILDDYANWSGMRVGMLQGNSRNEHFATYAAVHGFTYTAVYFDDTAEMLAALQSGNDVDAVITSNLRRPGDEWILAQFDPSPFYIMVQKGNAALLTEINDALDRMYAAMPGIDQMLMDQYYLTKRGDNIAFTLEERALIDATHQKPITIGVISSSAPVCFFDQASGTFVGISMEVLKAISNKTGLHFDFVPIDLTGNTPVGWLRAGEFDLVAGILKTDTFLQDPTLTLSDALMTDSLVMVGRAGNDFTQQPSEKTIAVLTGFQMGAQYVSEVFPNHKTVNLNSFDACMDAVADGSADAAVQVRTCASYALQDPHYDTLEIVPAYSREFNTCIAGLSADKALLISVIDKGIAMIADTERNAIMMNYTIMNPYQLSIGDTLYQHRVTASIIAALLLMLIWAGVLVALMRNRNAKKLRSAYEQTKEALAIAEKANAAKSQLLSRVSHEMRTPLNAIIGFLELARGGEGEEEVSTYLANAGIAAKQLLAAINDVLDVSSIDTGKLMLSRTAFDFHQLLHSVADVYRPQCRAKGLAFEIRFLTPMDEWLVGDPLRVNQILFNLLSNAMKFTNQGHVWLSVSQIGSKGDSVIVRMEVADTGCGMSQDMLSRLFAPFDREDGAAAAHYGDNGLGLSIVKNLVGQMNGTIRAESRPGVGSTFTIDIPFGVGDPLGSVQPTRKEENLDAVGQGHSLLTGKRVLLAEDNAMNRMVAEAILRKFGMEWESVSDGAMAVERFRTSPPGHFDVILMDIQMPHMDGLEAARRIRALDRADGKTVRIIALTANAYKEDMMESMSAGMNAHVPKPIEPEELAAALEKACRKSEAEETY